LGDATIGPEKQRIVLIELEPILVRSWQAQHCEALYEACRKQPKADPWTLDMIAGRYYNTLAWSQRGYGFAGDVTSDGAKLFQENMRKATEHLAAALKLHPEFPEAAGDMVAVAMTGEGNRTPRQWFDKAVAAEMDYLPAYDRLRWAMRPRWGGSHEQMYRFGCECADTERYDTNVPFVLVQILNDIDEETDYNGAIWRRNDVYPKVKRVLEGMAKEPTRADGQRSYLAKSAVMSVHAALTARCEAFTDGRRLLDELGDRLDREAFDNWCTHPEFGLAKIYGYSGKGAIHLKKAEQLLAAAPKPFSNAVLQEARSLYEKAVDAADDERCKAFPRCRREETNDYLAFNAGKWVEKKFDAGLLHWAIGGGKWSVENERSAVGATGKLYTKIYLRPIWSLSVPLEVEFDVEPSISTSSPIALGLFVPPRDETTLYNEGRHQFCVLPFQGEVGIQVGEQMKTVSKNLKVTNRIRVQLADGRAVFYVNDELCMEHRDKDFHPSGALNIGCHTPVYNDFRVRISNVRIRKWKPSL
jgi:hypothetical protein